MPFSLHESVLITHDCDGAEGRIGVIRNVWESGRYTVEFPDGSFRSMVESVLQRAVTKDLGVTKE